MIVAAHTGLVNKLHCRRRVKRNETRTASKHGSAETQTLRERDRGEADPTESREVTN